MAEQPPSREVTMSVGSTSIERLVACNDDKVRQMATLAEEIVVLVSNGFTLQFSAGALGNHPTLVMRMNRAAGSALDAVIDADDARRDEVVLERLQRMRGSVEGQERVKVLHEQYGGDPFN